MRLQALDQQLCDLPVGSLDIGTRGEEKETVDRVALDRRQVVALGPQQHREQDRARHEPDDPAQAARLGTRESDYSICKPVPGRNAAVVRRQVTHPVARRGRQYRDRDEQRNGDTDRDRQSEVGEHLTFDVAQEHDGDEDRHGCRSGSEQGAPHLRRAVIRGIGGRLASLPQAHDVFEHDNCGIEHHAGGECEAGERNDVQGPTGERQNDKGRQQRHRDRKRNNQRRPPLAEEQPQHADGEQDAGGEIAGEQVDRALDVDRRVEAVCSKQVPILEVRFIELVHATLDAVERLEHVGFVGLGDREARRGTAVVVDEAFAFRRAVSYARDIAELDGQATAPVEDQVLQVVNVVSPFDTQGIAAAADVDDTGRYVGRTTDAISGARDIDAEFGCLVRVDDDLQLVARIAARVEHADPRYAIEAGDLGPDDFAQISLVANQVLFGAIELLDEILDELVVRVTPLAHAHVGAVGVAGQRAQAVETTDDVDQCARHVGLERELELDPGEIRHAPAGHLRHVGRALQHLLDRHRDFRLDFPRGRAGPGGADRHDGFLDPRQQLRRDTENRDCAEQHDDRSDDRHGGRIGKARSCQPHRTPRP